MSNITELRQNFVDIQAITLKVIAFEIFRVIAVIWIKKIVAMTLSIIVFNFLNMSKNKYNCFVLWIYVYFFALVLAKLSIQVRYSSMLYNNLILHC